MVLNVLILVIKSHFDIFNKNYVELLKKYIFNYN